MIQGYRMVGPPPQGEPPGAPDEPAEPGWPPWIGFLTLVVAFFVANLGVIVLIGVSGTKADATPAWVDLSAALILQSTFVASALVAAGLIKRVHPWQFGLRSTRLWRALAWSVVGMVAFYLAVGLWATLVGPPEQSTAEDVGANEGQVAVILAGLLFVWIAPVVEEFFFRGFFYGALRNRLRPVTAAIVCGAVFGGIHVASGPSAVPVLIVFGIVLCLVREKTGSLYPCIAMHAVNNTIAYATVTDVEPGIAIALGAAMLLACILVPRFAWRTQPQPA